MLIYEWRVCMYVTIAPPRTDDRHLNFHIKILLHDYRSLTCPVAQLFVGRLYVIHVAYLTLTLAVISPARSLHERR